MKYLITMLCCVGSGALSQGFSEGSEAKEWGLIGEQKALFAATVVDPLCELTGDCPDNCGDGRRQLALLRTVDNVMVLPLKNSQAAFTGAPAELLPFCGQAVEVDGVLLEDEEIGSQNVYMVQRIRALGSEDWIKANRWTKDWAEKHPEAKGKGPWFRRDPRVLAEIEREGWLGRGPDQEQAFVEEWLAE